MCEVCITTHLVHTLPVSAQEACKEATHPPVSQSRIWAGQENSCGELRCDDAVHRPEQIVSLAGQDFASLPAQFHQGHKALKPPVPCVVFQGLGSSLGIPFALVCNSPPV
jgi:hypothetical protein